jgi:hypothetical protein
MGEMIDDAKRLVEIKLEIMDLANEIAAIINKYKQDFEYQANAKEWINNLNKIINSINGPHCKKCGRAIGKNGKHMFPMTTPCGELGDTPEV